MGSLSSRLKYARLKKKLTQQQLAEKVGIKQQAIQRIEANKVRSTSYIVQIAQVLDVSPEWLALGHGSNSVHTIQENGDSYTTKNVTFVPLLTFPDISVYLNAGANEDKKVSSSRQVPFIGHFKGQGYALEVKDDSMVSTTGIEPSFMRGDVLVIDSGLKPSNDAYVIVAPDGQPASLIFRQYISDSNGGYVRAYNPKFRSIVCHRSIAQFLGVVVQRISYLD